ncbi:MAG: Amidase [Paracidovorax wautersii]|uniref:Amidase n=1 Tax=Paracidovorax wautersii TaxID=1177982 RepID=A0A7V8FNB3_9BURK|nr:MAG: Amidase [Paracidovorax wautersii]
MTLIRPTLDQLAASAESVGIVLERETLAQYAQILEATFRDYDEVDRLAPEQPAVRYPRTPGTVPAAHDNPLGAWHVQTRIEGAASGPLAGKTVVLKDNMCLAGVPMMNGSSTLRGYVPDVDATVATRVLDAGGTIVGKAHCEFFCVSGSSHTSAAGPVRNPVNPAHSSGGSSSGCAALVGAGEVDMAIGTDQGGSVRIPAAYSGIVGMKPTWGLVPYTGIMPIEMTLDHAGPMTRTVADNALLLQALAGPDGLDPRQQGHAAPRDYTSGLGQSCQGLRVAVVTEGFGWDNAEADVDAAVRQAGQTLRRLGAQVEAVSIPLHRLGHAIWAPIAVEGTTQLLKGFNYGSNWKGLYVTSLMRAQQDWTAHAADFPHDLKTCLIAGEYFSRRYGGRYYAHAQNLARRLRAAYDDVLSRFDALLMPTVPLKAPRLIDAQATPATFVTRALEMNANTAPFDVTGHPAISVPCGYADGLPIGAMLVGADHTETTLYRLASALERTGAGARPEGARA